MENIYVYAFATFGHPNDFNQVCFLPEKRQSDLKIKLFDLTSAIKLYPNTTLYSIRKENINGISSISYSIYTFAKEKLSERDGTFIGSSILYTSAIANENITIEKLNKFHNELIKKNVVEDRLIVSHSKEFSISKSVTNDFDKLAYNLKQIEEPSNFNQSNSSLVVYSRIQANTLQQNFKKSLELLNSFDTIFFTDNKDIAEFVKDRGLYKVTDENGFEKELQILIDEKKKRLQSTINDFEKELFELEENKRVTIQNFKNKIEQNSRLHTENGKKIEESKGQITDIENKYSEFSKKIREAINHINSNKKIEDVKLFHNENKREFINFVNQNIKPIYLNSIDNIQPKTSLSIKQENNPNWSKSSAESSNREQTIRKKPFKTFKLLSILFFTLWILTLLYFLFFNKTEQNPINKSNETIIENPVINDSIKRGN